MRRNVIILALTSVFALGAGGVWAQSGQSAMSGMDKSSMKGMSPGSMKGMSPMQGMGSMKGMGSANMMAMREDMVAMKKMSKGMMNAKGSTADITFARKMLAHHQGALDMATIELKHGSDAEAKRMAQQIIDEQTKGKAELEAWLKTHGG